MSIQPQGHTVTSAVVRYYKVAGVPSNEKQRHKSLNITPGYSFKKHRPLAESTSLQFTGKKASKYIEDGRRNMSA